MVMSYFFFDEATRLIDAGFEFLDRDVFRASLNLMTSGDPSAFRICRSVNCRRSSAVREADILRREATSP